MSEEILHFQSESEDTGKRLDLFLVEKLDNRSRSKIRRMIEDGDVLVNEQPSKASYKVRPNDEIDVDLPDIEAEIFQPEDIPLEIVYEDEHLAVVNKPAGLVVHPGAGIHGGTLANALAFHFGLRTEEDCGLRIADCGMEDPLGDQDEPDDSTSGTFRNSQSQIRNRLGLVHRLDKLTSGLILVAKSEDILEKLSEQFRERTVFKSYVALVHGWMETDTGTIDAPIAREKHNRTKMAVRAYGRNALSLWKVKKRWDKFTLVAVEIKTGRTHQIRVHLASINHPVVGDETYNAGRDKTVSDLTVRKAIADLGRFFLHAEKLSFTHPVTGERLNFTAPLPEELDDFLELLG